MSRPGEEPRAETHIASGRLRLRAGDFCPKDAHTVSVRTRPHDRELEPVFHFANPVSTQSDLLVLLLAAALTARVDVAAPCDQPIRLLAPPRSSGIAAAMRKLLTILNAMLRERRPWQLA